MRQKKCIWCFKTEPSVTFNKKAHTIPQSIGGKFICEDVCDDCNLYFGSKQAGLPSVEAAIKETFGIARARFMDASGKYGKNRLMPRFKSEYFNLDFKRKKIEFKYGFNGNLSFQENLAMQLKKGLFKMYLEELHRQLGTGFDDRYNFIRKFARFNLMNFPVIYFERKHGIILSGVEWVDVPRLIINEPFLQYLAFEESFYEFEMMGHVFGIPATQEWELDFDKYIRKSMKIKEGFFHSWKWVRVFPDIDFQLTILNDKM